MTRALVPDGPRRLADSSSEAGGLIGTVVGFIMATQALDMAAVGDTDRAAAMLGDLMAGMGVALYTTLCGAVASIWLMTCYRILQGAANSLAARVFES